MKLQIIYKMVTEETPPWPQIRVEQAYRTLKPLLSPKSFIGDASRAMAHECYERLVAAGGPGIPSPLVLPSAGVGAVSDRLIKAHWGMVETAIPRVLDEVQRSKFGVVKFTSDKPVTFDAAKKLVSDEQLRKLSEGEEFVSRSKIHPETGKRRVRRWITVCVAKPELERIEL